jgi:membrane protein implicated in regulation of membrane protease activity
MPGWVIWILAASALAVGEMLSLGLYLAPFAVAAVVAGLADAVGAGAVASWLVFIIGSVLALMILRPIARRHRSLPPSLRSGTAALVGKQAMVVERIANDEGLGCVRIDGEIWTARAYDDDVEIEQGKRVAVMEIRGATALVSE